MFGQRGTESENSISTPIPRCFCEYCNQVSISAVETRYLSLEQDGKLKFKSLLRAGFTDEELTLVITNAITRKPEHHVFNGRASRVMRDAFMSMTGS